MQRRLKPGHLRNLRAGMEQSAKIISINTDPEAPINAIADYTIIGDVMTVIPQFMACYKNNLK